MTNAESYLSEAIQKMKEGKLSEWQANFIRQFEGMSKKDLKTLSYKQYVKIREIARGK